MCAYLLHALTGAFLLDFQFCIDTVRRFTRNPTCLQKAGKFLFSVQVKSRLTSHRCALTFRLCPGIVFTSYYHNNPPGVYFSMPVLLTLLRTQLKAGMVSDVFSVLRASVAHRIVVSVASNTSSTFLFFSFFCGFRGWAFNFLPSLVPVTFDNNRQSQQSLNTFRES